MALTGTLRDIGVVALLQIPYTGRRTGLLSIESGNETADIWYSSGRLVHAELGNVSGDAVLVDVVDWKEGSFQFKTDVEATDQSIDRDLHQVIMWALKERDERKNAEFESIPAQTSVMETEMSSLLQEYVDENGILLFACLMSEDGQPEAITHQPKDLEVDLTGVMDAIGSLISEYPVKPVNRVIIEDESMTTGVAALENGKSLILVARSGTRMGVLSMTMGKIASGLK